MQLTPRHLVALLIVTGSLLLAVFLAKDYPSYASMAGVVGGIFGVLYAGTGSTAGPANDALIEAIRRASRGDAPAAPPGASGAALKMYEELARVSDEMRVHETREKQTVADTREAVQALDELLKKLGDGVTTQLSASEETARSIKDMTSALRDIAQHVEVLASSAEESSSSILEMTATNDEVAENACAKRCRRSKRWLTRSKRSPRTSTRFRSPRKKRARR